MEILFNNYQKAKTKAIELMKEEKIMGVMVGKNALKTFGLLIIVYVVMNIMKNL